MVAAVELVDEPLLSNSQLQFREFVTHADG
jgi:hypothetical protein